MNLKTPPHSRPAEEAVLGSLMLNELSYDLIGDTLQPGMFYNQKHAFIYNAIQDLATESRAYDAVTVAEQIEVNGHIDEASMQDLINLCESRPAATNIVSAANIIAKRAKLRELLIATNQISDAIYEGTMDEDTIIQMAEAKFTAASMDSNSKGLTHVSEVADEIMAEIEIQGQSEGLLGMSYGLKDIDRITSGLQPSDLVIIAGRPSMGKTSFAMNIAAHVAQTDNVAVFSMEMPKKQLHMRMLSSDARVELNKVRSGKLTQSEWALLVDANNRIKRSKLHWDETPALTPENLMSRARRLHRQCGGLKLIVIDYIQLMQTTGKGDNRNTEISQISGCLKALAKELDCNVIALSQLNRGLENRPDKRPIMSDLRESGAIEQDADVIAFVYRDEVYNPDSPNKGIAEILFRKQRNGPTGNVETVFAGQFTRFDNYYSGESAGHVPFKPEQRISA